MLKEMMIRGLSLQLNHEYRFPHKRYEFAKIEAERELIQSCEKSFSPRAWAKFRHGRKLLRKMENLPLTTKTWGTSLTGSVPVSHYSTRDKTMEKGREKKPFSLGSDKTTGSAHCILEKLRTRSVSGDDIAQQP